MTELMYDLPSGAIAVVLLLGLLAAIEGGLRFGRRQAAPASAPFREHVHGIQSAVLGLLALLLAFTFSLALQRYDSRSDAVVDEANAIGTAFLRADLLPAAQRDEARAAIARYLALRVREAQLPPGAPRGSLPADTAAAQAAVWRLAVAAQRAEPNLHGPQLFVQAVNAMIDSQGRRADILARHVPELVLLLLLGTFLLAGLTIGYASGVATHRPAPVTYLLVVLMGVLVFAILDLDRPRRGLIQVSHASLTGLQAAIQAGQWGPRP